MKAYSVDLRQRVLAALDRGMQRHEVIHTFGVSSGTVKRLLRKQQQGSDLAPQTSPGRPPTITPAAYPALRAQLAAHPDATFAAHAARWNAAHGTTLSQWTLGRVIRRLGWTRKKNAPSE